MIRKGSKVTWKWGNGEAEGKVIETFSEEITKTIKIIPKEVLVYSKNLKTINIQDY